MRAQMLSLVGVVLLALVFAVSVARSQKTADGDVIAEITRLEHEAVKADLANDRSFSDKYLADDFTAGSSWGNWDTRQSILNDFSEPQSNKTNKEEISECACTETRLSLLTKKPTIQSITVNIVLGRLL
jgi:hypothetical protein